MANISYKRLRCVTLATTQIGGRVFNYNGASANIDGSTDTLAIADVKASATWATATSSPFRAGDLILVSCTDGVLDVNVASVSNGVPTVVWLTQNATA